MTVGDLGNSLISRQRMCYPHPGGYAIIAMRDGQGPLGQGHDATTRRVFRVVDFVAGFPQSNQCDGRFHDATTRKSALSRVCVRARARMCAHTGEREIFCRGVVVISKSLADKEKIHDKGHDKSKLNVVVQFKPLKSLGKTHDSAKKGGF